MATHDTTGIVRVDELTFEERRVVMRVDFNVPLDGGAITDDARIRAALPTISCALEGGAVLTLCSHLGRPKGKVVEALRMEVVGARLAELLTESLGRNVEVIVPDTLVDDHIPRLQEQLRPRHQVLLLQNLRFDGGEKKGNPEFAKWLAGLGDLYVNDAFGTCHRAHASVYQAVEHFDRRHKAAGFLILKELDNLGGLLHNPARPFVAVMGGAKVSDKLGVLESLIDRVDAILVGGAMAYTFLKAQGHAVGDSLVEEDMLETAQAILTKASANQTTIHLPQDHVVASAIDAASGETTDGVDIGAGLSGFDVGPRTVAAYREVILGAATLFWNGPMGVFEHEPFAAGTFGVAQAMADTEANTCVGGGDSAAAVRQAGILDRIDHVSTGGGASLEFVEGRPLPGVEALRANHPFDLA